MKRRALGAALAVALGLAGALAACDGGDPPPVTCHDIPSGGCPLSGTNACLDPTCAAIYACYQGVWSLNQTCPPQNPIDSGVDAPTEPDATPLMPRDAGFDVPPGANGGPGCADLQPPDCTLGTAISCGPGCCECDNLYICQDAGWIGWGECIDGGIVLP